MSWLPSLCILAVLGSAAPQAAPVLPQTVERVWYRGVNRPFGKVFRAGGDLTIREDGLEFVHRKHGWSVPLDGISIISLGSMKGDVDTDWVILGLRDGQPDTVVGVRDGHRMGYGQETRGIYELLLDIARSRKIAQFDVPDGLEPYEPLDRMLAVAFPSGWHPFHLSRDINSDHVLPLGRTSFTPEPVETADQLAGGGTRLLVERTALSGYGSAGCSSGISGDLQTEIMERFTSDPVSMGSLTLVNAPQAAPLTIGTCRGVRVVAEGTGSDGVARRGDLVAVAWNGILFQVSLVADRKDGADLMEAILSTIKIARNR
ncbi:MAG: hypothetical protein IFK94_05420 [Acidobacteria bacterium]|uniref:Uncharacterized protein n=1 Tax=Candidatus Polarisedimenticola svalbardensis TaxID=2886004 RepID=A0A8J7C1I1_9BACT|nr:hypothetical protein [Candidatus Polarisedimenticola svalbardensis]